MSFQSGTALSPPPSSASRPAPTSLRDLAPDLARGVMLLVIALAHAHFFATLIGGTDHVYSTFDSVIKAGNTMLVELRAWPMFAALFGYGLAQIHRKRTAAGMEWPGIRSLLRRRARWLIAIGLVHVILLFPGDILSVYGLVTLALVGAVRFRARTLAILAAAWLPLGATFHAFAAAQGVAAGTDGLPPMPMPEGVADELFWRLAMFGILVVQLVICTVVPLLVGILAARHRILEEPQRHRRLLRQVAFTGIPVGLLGGLPLALAKSGVWVDYSPLNAFFAGGLHQVTGYASGLGYAALIALAAARLAGREGPVTNALSALGQRSMTFYLAQSLAWAVLFASYALHLQVASPALAAVIGMAVWLLTLVAADQMARRGMRGPAETALRTVMYRKA